MKRISILSAALAAAVLLCACTHQKQPETIALFGGSFSVIPASEVATQWWEEQLGAKVVKYGAGGAGFSNRTQGSGKHIQWQIDSACAPDAPVYDTYVLWASTNDFTKVNELSGEPLDYSEADGYDPAKLETQCGGINYAIRRIREKAPDARILFMTSTKCFTAPGAGTAVNYQDTTGKTGMNEFVAKQILCCQLAGVPYLDLFTLAPFNERNFTQFVQKDNLHLSEAGYEAIRDLQVEFLRSGRTMRGQHITLPSHSSRDWGGLGRYAAANALQKPPKAVLFGDSITQNWPMMRPDFFKDHDFAGRGISSQTTAEGLVRFRNDVINLHPEYVFILYGVNDVAEHNGAIDLENAVGNIASMVELVRAHGIKPVLCTILPATHAYWIPAIGQISTQVMAFNKLLLAYAEQEKLPVVDYWTPMNDGRGGLSPEHSRDGVHPTPAGYEIMESLLLSKLAELETGR